MYVTLVIIICVGLFLLLANASISFSPFTIKLQTPFFAIAYVLIAIAVALIMEEKYSKGHAAGYIEGYKESMENELIELDKYYLVPKNETPPAGKNNFYKADKGIIIQVLNVNEDNTAQTN